MQTPSLYLRTVVFGVIDSLVSTVGLLAGVGIAGVPRGTIILTGVVYAVVEAFSMAVGNFLSEESAEEYEHKVSNATTTSFMAALIMFLTFALAAFIPIAPYIFFSAKVAFGVSICAAVLGLFVAGMISARYSRLPVLWRGARMALLGGAAILLGLVVGSLVPGV